MIAPSTLNSESSEHGSPSSSLPGKSAPSYSKANATAAAEVLAKPLYSAEAEKAVLASMLARPNEVIDRVFEKLIAADFFVPANRELFQSLWDLHKLSQAIDVTTVHQYLTDRGMAEKVGSPAILAELIAGLATHLNVNSYITIVKEKSLLRSLQSACAEIAQLVVDNQSTVSRVLDLAEKKVFDVTNLGMTNSTKEARTEIDKAVSIIESFQKRKGKLYGIPTGFHRLNELTTGWQKGDMIVLAARPGAGKTALALTFARHAMASRYDEKIDNWVKPGYGVGVFSLEMTNEQLLLRMLASYASERLQDIRQGKLDDQAMQKLKMIAEDMKEYPLYLDDSSFLTINQLRGKARRMKQMYDINFLVIDYLQLLHSESDQAKDNRQNEVAEISRGIKALAKELDIPILVLAQLNRKSEESNAEPALHNLRESGAIEQDADVVLMLHRPKPDADAPPSHLFDYKLIIAKQRSGPTDTVPIKFNSQYTRFEDPVRQ